MASEWIMYLSVIGLGVMVIAGVTLTFDSINRNTITSTIEVGLHEVASIVAKELKKVLELGMSTDPLTRVNITRTIVLPTDLGGQPFVISPKFLIGVNHWYLSAKGYEDKTLEVLFETVIPSNIEIRDQTLLATNNTIFRSSSYQHIVGFVRKISPIGTVIFEGLIFYDK